MNLAKTAAGSGLFLAACAACCAPLIAPPLIAVLAAGGTGLALVGQVGLALAVIAGGDGYVWWTRGPRRAEASGPVASEASSRCGCSANANAAADPTKIKSSC